MDALCNTFYKGKMYNGFSQMEVTSNGAKKLAVTTYKAGIFTRGIPIDIPRLRNLPYLGPDVAIYPEELDNRECKVGIHISSGDVVFLRTGRWATRAAKGPWDTGARSAGFYASCARCLHQRDVAMIGSHAASDVMPSRIAGVAQPIHQLMLVALGIPIFDNCNLEALAEAAGPGHH